MAKGTALVKGKKRYKKLIGVFPEREEFYLQKIQEIDAQIKEMGVCRRCGRPLSDQDAIDAGYGKECLAKTDTEEDE